MDGWYILDWNLLTGSNKLEINLWEGMVSRTELFWIKFSRPRLFWMVELWFCDEDSPFSKVDGSFQSLEVTLLGAWDFNPNRWSWKCRLRKKGLAGWTIAFPLKIDLSLTIYIPLEFIFLKEHFWNKRGTWADLIGWTTGVEEKIWVKSWSHASWTIGVLEKIEEMSGRSKLFTGSMPLFCHWEGTLSKVEVWQPLPLPKTSCHLVGWQNPKPGFTPLGLIPPSPLSEHLPLCSGIATPFMSSIRSW